MAEKLHLGEFKIKPETEETVDGIRIANLVHHLPAVTVSHQYPNRVA